MRYQALIVEADRALLIRHKEHATGREYWVLPGGGIEAGETSEECVAREALEETHLSVRVERLLFEESATPRSGYRRRSTYLCTPLAGEARAGYEPEAEAVEVYAITEVAWFDLSTEAGWGADLIQDPVTYPQMHRARETLGYCE